jgi:hypothetical protein
MARPKVVITVIDRLTYWKQKCDELKTALGDCDQDWAERVFRACLRLKPPAPWRDWHEVETAVEACTAARTDAKAAEALHYLATRVPAASDDPGGF